MKYFINAIATHGPTVYNTDEVCKYLTIGVKYNSAFKDNSSIITPDILDNMILHIKDAILKSNKNVNDEVLNQGNIVQDENFGIISLTDKFFEYIKNNETKIQAIRVSLNDYDHDHKEQKLKTLKTKMIVVTADDDSMNDMFNMVVKELYYEYGDAVIDLYSIILTPKQYKIINNIPVEYRSVLIRVKK